MSTTETAWTAEKCGTANTFVPAVTQVLADGTHCYNTDGTTRACVATDASYITYDSATYPEMFRIGKTEDGTQVYVEKTKN